MGSHFSLSEEICRVLKGKSLFEIREVFFKSGCKPDSLVGFVDNPIFSGFKLNHFDRIPDSAIFTGNRVQSGVMRQSQAQPIAVFKLP